MDCTVTVAAVGHSDLVFACRGQTMMCGGVKQEKTKAHAED